MADDNPQSPNRNPEDNRPGNQPRNWGLPEGRLAVIPKDLPEHLASGFDLLEQGEFVAACEFFALAVRQHPQTAEAWFGYGQAAFWEKEYFEAAAWFDEAQRLGMDSPEVDVFLAWCGYHGAGDEEDRIFHTERALAVDPNHARALFLLGDALADLNLYDEAIECFQRCLEIQPLWCEPNYFWANCLRAKGELEAADVKYYESAKYDTYDGNIIHRRAHHFEDSDPVQALADFDLSVERGHHGNHCRDGMLYSYGWDGDEDPAAFIANLDKEEDTLMSEKRYFIFETVREHFNNAHLDEIEITQRSYPFRAGPDLQIGLNDLEAAGYQITHFFSARRNGSDDFADKFAKVYTKDRRNPLLPVSPSYQEIDIGEEKPLRCLTGGIWLLKVNDIPVHLLLFTGRHDGIHLEIAVPAGEAGAEVAAELFNYFSKKIEESRCYRGKILSLEHHEMYSGTHAGILVHRLKTVSRDQVILPAATVDMLDRNILRFAAQRKRLAELGLSTKKGLLFYGPPGTGKTHTVHYLARVLEGSTVFLITGEQVGQLDDYMTLARMLQPAIVVLEDVDLIARHRDSMRSPTEEVMLNKLLNEMDGTRQDAELIFILTTNRPSVLEEALTARPGRIDQAIEFPLPDAEGRARLVDLYSQTFGLSAELKQHIVDRTEYVSASFIRELMRRSIQYALERDVDSHSLEQADVDAALDELLTTGGSLNRALLGASGRDRVAGFHPRADK